MSVHVSIVDGPVLPLDSVSSPEETVGARLVFEGIVRRAEGVGHVIALSYEAYEPMASRMLHRIASDVLAAHSLSSIQIEHSRGLVPVGAASLRVIIDSPHRQESLAAMGELIDRLKKDVPIWKMPVWQPPAEQ